MATNSEILAFMELFGRLAVAECNNRIAAGKGFILPSVAMAQSALESDWGQAGLMKKANAFFGVKAGGSWTGKVYSASTWEVVQGEVHNITANFRAYDSPADSMTDYYELTCSLSRYANGVSYGSDRSKWLTAKETITALWKGGYASDDLYVNKIMNTINGRDLTKYDALITGEGTLNPDEIVTPTININVKSGDLVSGSTGYVKNAWTHAALQTGLTTPIEKLITIESSGNYIFNGIPDGATFYIQTTDGSRTLSNGEATYLEEGDVIALNFVFDSLAAATAANFTLTVSNGVLTNENAVLAYFIKI